MRLGDYLSNSITAFFLSYFGFAYRLLKPVSALAN
jgi:hypothetical protein